jgi:hypothetical protein
MSWYPKFDTSLAPDRSLRRLRKQALLVWALPVVLFLGGCEAQPECDSTETRNAVLQSVSNDHNNHLAAFAAKNSNAAGQKPDNAGPDAGNSTNPENTRPEYRLGEKMITQSVSADKQTLQCSGAISATVGNTKASKEVNFTVQRLPDGKLSVSVAPFQF